MELRKLTSKQKEQRQFGLLTKIMKEKKILWDSEEVEKMLRISERKLIELNKEMSLKPVSFKITFRINEQFTYFVPTYPSNIYGIKSSNS